MSEAVAPQRLRAGHNWLAVALRSERAAEQLRSGHQRRDRQRVKEASERAKKAHSMARHFLGDRYDVELTRLQEVDGESKQHDGGDKR